MPKYPDVGRNLSAASRLTPRQTAEGLQELMNQGGFVELVSASRDLGESDNGKVLECAATLTLTVPAGLPRGFSCAVIAAGTTSVASSGGTLLNGATSTLTRAAAANSMFAIQARASAPDSYVVTGE